VPAFLYHMYDHSSLFSDKKNGYKRPLLSAIMFKTDHVGAKMLFSTIFYAISISNTCLISRESICIPNFDKKSQSTDEIKLLLV